MAKDESNSAATSK